MTAIGYGQRTLVREKFGAQKHQAAKTLAYSLAKAGHRQRNMALSEIRRYGQFDRDCNYKLRRLYVFLNRQARDLKKDAVLTWYRAYLKPTGTIGGNEALAV